MPPLNDPIEGSTARIETALAAYQTAVDDELDFDRLVVAACEVASVMCDTWPTIKAFLDAYPPMAHKEHCAATWGARCDCAFDFDEALRKKLRKANTTISRLRALIRDAEPWVICDCPDDPISGTTRHYGDECILTKLTTLNREAQ